MMTNNAKMKDGIKKRGKNYYFILRVPDPVTGKRKQKWVVGAPTRAATIAMRDKARAAMHDGTWVAPQNLTVGEWLDRWMLAHEVELKPSTVSSYRAKINLYLKPTLGHERLQSLSPSGLSLVWRDLQDHGGHNGKGLSRRTVEFTRAVLRKALEDAVIERVLQVNPVVGSKMAKREGKPKHVTWTGIQLRTFLDNVQDDRWAALWSLLAGTGQRRGEAAGLRWEDEFGPVVDLDAGTLRVERSTTEIHGRRVTTTPKNHERRTIALDPATIAILRSWKASQAREKLAAGPAWVDAENVVFTWPDGRPIMPDYISKSFLKAQTRVNADMETSSALPRITVHQLRHTHATLLLRSRVPVHIVAKRLGHKDPSVTLDVYADAIPDDDVSAVEVYSSVVWGSV